MIESATQLLTKCANGDGRIVCTGDLTEMQIAEARVNDLMYVDADGIGYVLLPWDLTTGRDRERERSRSSMTAAG